MTPEQQIQQLQRKLNTKEYLLNVASNSSDYFEQQMQLAQAERDALQAELSSLKADMFVLNNDLGYTTGVLEDVLKQRDALQARVDGAVDRLKKHTCYSAVAHAIEILTGEGE